MVIAQRTAAESADAMLSAAKVQVLAALREVVPCPAELDALPVVAPGLLGAMTLRGTVVPVIDLATALGRDHERAHGQVVVVVAQANQVLGVLVDEVRGMAALPDSSLSTVASADGGLLFERTFPDPTSGRVVSLVDPRALLQLPGVPVVREEAAAAATTSAAAVDRAQTRSLTSSSAVRTGWRWTSRTSTRPCRRRCCTARGSTGRCASASRRSPASPSRPPTCSRCCRSGRCATSRSAAGSSSTCPTARWCSPSGR